MLGISEQPAAATMNAPSPARSGGLRPNLSLGRGQRLAEREPDQAGGQRGLGGRGAGV